MIEVEGLRERFTEMQRQNNIETRSSLTIPVDVSKEVFEDMQNNGRT